MTRKPLTAVDIRVLDALAAGKDYREIARRAGLQTHCVKQRLQRMKAIAELEETQKDPRILLAQWWTTELFRTGLKELGLLHEANALRKPELARPA